jgi:hypothetical protein
VSTHRRGQRQLRHELKTRDALRNGPSQGTRRNAASVARRDQMTRTPLWRRYSRLFGPDTAAGHRTASRKGPGGRLAATLPPISPSVWGAYLRIPNIVRILWHLDCFPRSRMNNALRSNYTCEKPQCGKQIVAIFLRSANVNSSPWSCVPNQLRSGAIREAAHLAAGTDVGLEQGIIDACFRRQLHYDPAHEYADNIIKVIEEITE